MDQEQNIDGRPMLYGQATATTDSFTNKDLESGKTEVLQNNTSEDHDGVLVYKKSRRGKRGTGKKNSLKPEEKFAKAQEEARLAEIGLEKEREAAKLVAPPPKAHGTGKKRRKTSVGVKRNNTNTKCPPAPRNTTQFLIAEHMEAGTDVPTVPPLIDEFQSTEEAVLTRKRVSSESITGGVPYGFEDDYEKVLYGDLDDKDKDFVVKRLKQVNAENEDLKATVMRLQSAEMEAKETILRLQERIECLENQVQVSRLCEATVPGGVQEIPSATSFSQPALDLQWN
eukprot:CFRG4901T1